MHLHTHDRHEHGTMPRAHDLDTTWRRGNARRLSYALAINLALIASAVIGAALTGSVALFADAGHVLSDVLAIALGLGAARMAMRPAAGRGTFGLGRVEILAALTNGVSLVAIAVWIAIESIGRLPDPPSVDGAGVLIFGAAGLIGNALATLVLAGGNRRDVNLEAVLRHSFADALGSLGVLFAGVGILVSGWQVIDPIVGLAIAALILLSSARLIREPVDVLLERAPAGLDVNEIGGAIAAVSGVLEVHDLHVWSITSGFPALAAHVTVEATHEIDRVRTDIEAMLASRFDVTHTTLQLARVELLQLEDGPNAPAGP